MNSLPIDQFIQKLQVPLYDINVSARKTADDLQQQNGWNDNDARIYFFNALGQASFLHGLTLNFIDNEIRQNKNQWREKQTYFQPSGQQHEFENIVDNYSGLVRDNYFLDVLILIEHCLRIFGEKITPAITSDKIATIKDQLVKQLQLDNDYKNLFDIIFKIRNTIHNAGLHSDNKPSITYRGKSFDFVEDKETQTSLDNIEFLFKEAISFMEKLFKHPISKQVNNIEHPYKPLFNQTT